MIESLPVAILGGGPAGLAAAEMLCAAGHRPVVFEAKPSLARKFLMAGKSGLNLTKDEASDIFAAAIGAPELAPALVAFGPAEARAWAEGLGEPMFTGSSGRVFPVSMKGSPLLRRWIARLTDAGCTFRTRWRWTGWNGSVLTFDTPQGARLVHADAVVMGFGGASWPRLGSDGAWTGPLAAAGVAVTPFQPANMGFDCAWSDHFRDRFAGAAVKPVALTVGADRVQGEFVITAGGIEGSAVYAVSRALRAACDAGAARLELDLAPDLTVAALTARLSRPRGKTSISNHLRRCIGLEGVRAGLLREATGPLPDDPAALARAIKAAHLPILRPRPLTEAISSAGGVAWAEVDASLMLRRRPGTFIAGEMLDWEAPTGGYLLTATIATGRLAGRSAADWLGAGLPARDG